MTAPRGSSGSGWFRLLAYSLGAAIIAVALSRLRRSKLLPESDDDDHIPFTPPPRNRSQRLRNLKPPVSRVERLRTASTRRRASADRSHDRSTPIPPVRPSARPATPGSPDPGESATNADTGPGPAAEQDTPPSLAPRPRPRAVARPMPFADQSTADQSTGDQPPLPQPSADKAPMEPGSAAKLPQAPEPASTVEPPRAPEPPLRPSSPLSGDARTTQDLDPHQWPQPPPAPPAASPGDVEPSDSWLPSDGPRPTLNPAQDGPAEPTLPLADRPQPGQASPPDQPVGQLAPGTTTPDSSTPAPPGTAGHHLDPSILDAATTTVDFTSEIDSVASAGQPVGTSLPAAATDPAAAIDPAAGIDPVAAIDHDLGSPLDQSTPAGPANAGHTVRTITPPQKHRKERSGRPFYGWILVGAVFFILCITSGIGFYNASVILSAAIRELDASVGSVSGATGLFFAFGGLTGFVFSKRLESVDIRWFFVAGGLVGAAALLGLRWVTSVAGLYVFFGFFGVAFGLAGLVPATTLVTRWFDRRRSVALSIASTGLSVGGIVVTPFSDWLIEQRTLSGAAPYLAAIWIVGVIPVALLFVRSYPADKGLHPDGDEPPATTVGAVANRPTVLAEGQDGSTNLVETAVDSVAGAAPSSAPAPAVAPAPVAGLSFARARTSRFFIALCLAYAVIFFGQVGGIAQLFNMILERTDAPTARTALAVLAGSSVVFRLLGGAAVLRVPTKAFSAALAVAQAAALILLAVATSSTGLILSAAFFGCSIGNLLMLQPLLLAEAFGVANYGRIYSFNQLFGTIGVAGGPLALGLIHDVSDYRAAFFAAAAASFVGCLAIIAAGSTSKVQVLWS